MQKCPICGEAHSAGSGKANKSKQARIKKPQEFNRPEEWLGYLRQEVGYPEGFYAAIRHETGSRPVPTFCKPPYDGCFLNDVPDKWYKEWINKDGKSTMTGQQYGGKTDLWYYTLAVNELDPEKYAKEHNLTLASPPRKCPACGATGSPRKKGGQRRFTLR